MKTAKGENGFTNSVRRSLSPAASLKVSALISTALFLHHVHFKMSKNRSGDKAEGTPIKQIWTEEKSVRSYTGCLVKKRLCTVYIKRLKRHCLLNVTLL